ncbi:hypothetical protein [Halomarina pelagica]|uniref:hypothetical protein n=1 Tax=Halomarina pelagica TaxID=2961599 RepID=UPI0020C22C63|nr:hypothetical protein [Halomarina sp. BND7]
MHERGEVVWYPALFADYDRPFLLVSTDTHPFHEEEHVGLAITTTALDDAIPIVDDDWVIGDLPKRSYVKPWNPVIVKEDTIRSVAGVLRSEQVNRAVAELAAICGVE